MKLKLILPALTEAKSPFWRVLALKLAKTAALEKYLRKGQPVSSGDCGAMVVAVVESFAGEPHANSRAATRDRQPHCRGRGRRAAGLGD